MGVLEGRGWVSGVAQAVHTGVSVLGCCVCSVHNVPGVPVSGPGVLRGAPSEAQVCVGNVEWAEPAVEGMQHAHGTDVYIWEWGCAGWFVPWCLCTMHAAHTAQCLHCCTQGSVRVHSTCAGHAQCCGGAGSTACVGHAQPVGIGAVGTHCACSECSECAVCAVCAVNVLCVQYVLCVLCLQ